MSSHYQKHPNVDYRQLNGLGNSPEPTLHTINTSAAPVGVSVLTSKGNQHETYGNRQTTPSKGNLYVPGGRGWFGRLLRSQKRISEAGAVQGWTARELPTNSHQQGTGSISDRRGGLDKEGLFRTPIRLKGPSAGQMLMKAIDRESLATSKAALSEAILSQAAPKYSLKTQLWIGAWIFLSIASGVALGFMKGCR